MCEMRSPGPNVVARASRRPACALILPSAGACRRRVARIAAEPTRPHPACQHTGHYHPGKRETLLPFLGWPQLLMTWV
jgi:hypothetical protein